MKWLRHRVAYFSVDKWYLFAQRYLLCWCNATNRTKLQDTENEHAINVFGHKSIGDDRCCSPQNSHIFCLKLIQLSFSSHHVSHRPWAKSFRTIRMLAAENHPLWLWIHKLNCRMLKRVKKLACRCKKRTVFSVLLLRSGKQNSKLQFARKINIYFRFCCFTTTKV